MRKSTQRYRPKASTRGFTVIEILIGLTVASAMGLLVVPRIQDGLQRNAVRSARAVVATQLARARGIAAGRGCFSTIHFTGGTDPRVWITSCPVTGSTAQIDTVGTVDALSTGSLVSLSTTAPSISFAPTGVATASSWTHLTFTRGEYLEQLAVSPVGKVSW